MHAECEAGSPASSPSSLREKRPIFPSVIGLMANHALAEASVAARTAIEARIVHWFTAVGRGGVVGRYAWNKRLTSAKNCRL
jgi:hypothetical protein